MPAHVVLKLHNKQASALKTRLLSLDQQQLHDFTWHAKEFRGGRVREGGGAYTQFYY